MRPRKDSGKTAGRLRASLVRSLRLSPSRSYRLLSSLLVLAVKVAAAKVAARFAAKVLESLTK